jgi:hypothetical protein
VSSGRVRAEGSRPLIQSSILPDEKRRVEGLTACLRSRPWYFLSIQGNSWRCIIRIITAVASRLPLTPATSLSYSSLLSSSVSLSSKIITMSSKISFHLIHFEKKFLHIFCMSYAGNPVWRSSFINISLMSFEFCHIFGGGGAWMGFTLYLRIPVAVIRRVSILPDASWRSLKFLVSCLQEITAFKSSAILPVLKSMFVSVPTHW